MIDIEEVLNDLEYDRHDMPYDVYSHMHDNICLIWDELDKLRAENAKLRELCADISSCHIDKSCENCDMRGQCHDEMETLSRWDKACLFERRIDQRMRELGIEEDE